MTTNWTRTALLGAGLAALVAAAQVETVAIERRAPPRIDGVLSPGEWPERPAAAMSGGSSITVAHDGSDLFVAIRSPRDDGFPHICLARGDTTLVLHASAALGRARYEGASLRERFEWRVRRRDTGDEAMQERDQHHQRFGWVASTAAMSQDGITEFRIARSLLDPADPRFAVAYFHEPVPGTIQVEQWPRGVHDGCFTQRMLQGYDVDGLVFNPANWPALSFTAARPR